MQNQDLPVIDRIINAATRLFAQKGYDGTTTREIVKEAGASLSSVQLHFKSKEMIYREAVNQAVGKYYSLFKPTLEKMAVMEESGMLQGECAWSYLSEIINIHTEWVFVEEYHNAILLMNRETIDEYPLMDTLPEQASTIMKSIQTLCESYVGAYGNTWAKALAHYIVMTVWGVANSPRIYGQVTEKDMSLHENMVEMKSLLADYLLITVKAYLDKRKADIKTEHK